jgi:hypothetical protein
VRRRCWACMQVDAVVLLDWDFSVLGSGAARFVQRAAAQGLLASGCMIVPSAVKVMAMAVEVRRETPRPGLRNC